MEFLSPYGFLQRLLDKKMLSLLPTQVVTDEQQSIEYPVITISGHSWTPPLGPSTPLHRVRRGRRRTLSSPSSFCPSERNSTYSCSPHPVPWLLVPFLRLAQPLPLFRPLPPTCIFAVLSFSDFSFYTGLFFIFPLCLFSCPHLVYDAFVGVCLKGKVQFYYFSLSTGHTVIGSLWVFIL